MRCPLCRKKKITFEKHHVIWRMDGGTNHKSNLVEICTDCHHIINYGDAAQSVCLEQLCLLHQLSEYGLEFIYQSGVLTGTHRLKDKFAKALEDILADDAPQANELFKAIGEAFEITIPT